MHHLEATCILPRLLPVATLRMRYSPIAAASLVLANKLKSGLALLGELGKVQSEHTVYVYAESLLACNL